MLHGSTENYRYVYQENLSFLRSLVGITVNGICIYGSGVVLVQAQQEVPEVERKGAR